MSDLQKITRYGFEYLPNYRVVEIPVYHIPELGLYIITPEMNRGTGFCTCELPGFETWEEAAGVILQQAKERAEDAAKRYAESKSELDRLESQIRDFAKKKEAGE